MGDWLTDLAARSLGAAPTARPTPRIYAGGAAPRALDFPPEPADDPPPIEAVPQANAQPAPPSSPRAEGPSPIVRPARPAPRSDPTEIEPIRAEPRPTTTSARRAEDGSPREEAAAPAAVSPTAPRRRPLEGPAEVAAPADRVAVTARPTPFEPAAASRPAPPRAEDRPEHPSAAASRPAAVIVPRRDDPAPRPDSAARRAAAPLEEEGPRGRVVAARPVPPRRVGELTPPEARSARTVVPPAPPPPAPAITVTIGRIEIRAVGPPATTAASRRPAPAEPAGRELLRYLSGERRGGSP